MVAFFYKCSCCLHCIFLTNKNLKLAKFHHENLCFKVISFSFLEREVFFAFPKLILIEQFLEYFRYEPFLTKEFPCATCKMEINDYYRHMLET